MPVFRKAISKGTWIGAASLIIWSGFAGSAFAVPYPVPELDPGFAASGLALLVSGGLLLFERYWRS